jgi:hypothetical protein
MNKNYSNGLFIDKFYNEKFCSCNQDLEIIDDP